MDAPYIRKQLSDKKIKVLRRYFRRSAASPYVPIYHKVLLPGERLPFDAYLLAREEKQKEGHFLPYVQTGELLEPKWIELLQETGIELLYLHPQDLERVIAYLNKRLQAFSSQEEPSPQQIYLYREHLLFSMHLAFSSPKLGNHIQLAKTMVGEIINLLQKDLAPWKLISEILYKDYSLYNHSVNVALLTMAMTIFLGKTKGDGLILGLAGLFHDLGLTRVNKEIDYNREGLCQEDWELLKDHPMVGYKLLQSYAAMPEEACRLVLEHHENADGSGYPQGLTLAQQHPWTRLLRLVDAYDSITCHRPSGPGHKPFAALKLLQEQRGPKGAVFEAETLKYFIRFLAFT
ncbi:MAG: HD domain-containing phosphohydrolase [Thermodesulfobacteriota bacterium]